LLLDQEQNNFRLQEYYVIFKLLFQYKIFLQKYPNYYIP